MFGHDNNRDDQQVKPQDSTDETAGVGNEDGQTPLPQPQHDALAPTDDSDISSITPTEVTPVAPAAEITDELLDIKQEALHELTPLVGQLDQTPEEQFRTTMMMIQASDNHALIRTAYEAAKGISSEKERAQALLDIVNEINYFTQHHQA